MVVLEYREGYKLLFGIRNPEFLGVELAFSTTDYNPTITGVVSYVAEGQVLPPLYPYQVSFIVPDGMGVGFTISRQLFTVSAQNARTEIILFTGFFPDLSKR